MSFKEMLALAALITIAIALFNHKSDDAKVYIPGSTGYGTPVTLTKDQRDSMTTEEAYNAMVPPEDRSGCKDDNSNCIDSITATERLDQQGYTGD